ncbi:MAG: 16S rRNA (uracil(1498)-N(3))-methyltransferase [Clostridia bacterium]|nr:16S rRNA (uracil(1498)-N(3))-methyltransferase [Clostridia bacterium]
MPRFFVPGEGFDGEYVSITGDDAWHIARSLRMAVGESITVCDTRGDEHICTLQRITDALVTARIEESLASAGEMPLGVVLYQALPKGDKMDLIVQKAVEMGADRIVPFLSERCVSRPDGASLEKKCARWQRIALEAAKQCGRGRVPTIGAPLSYTQMLADAGEASLGCFCYEGDGTVSLRTLLGERRQSLAPKGDRKDIALVIGSEGGFSEREAASASEAGLVLCGLGKRILRCESASGFALACISYEFEL